MTLPALEDVRARYEAVVGLELHVQLATRTKAFCGCTVAFGGAPNSRTCPVCAGHPGALPVLGAAVVAQALRLGLALDATPHRVSRFDRKSYFYPDLPKGYQITQAVAPLFTGGALAFPYEGQVRTVPLTRLHLEEDAGKLVHRADGTWVDLNRAGVPLAEVVTAPALASGAEAAAAVRALRDLVRWLGVGDADMAQGGLRCDVNVSVRPRGSGPASPRVEVKNLNSFRFVAQAVDHEVRRLAAALEAGAALVPETRGFDEATATTRPQRAKEGAAEYRYLPEPDLPPLVLDPEAVASARNALPVLPLARRAGLVSAGVTPDRAEALTGDRDLCALFDAVLAADPEAAPDPLAAFVIEVAVPEAGRQGVDLRSLSARADDLARLRRRLDEGILSASAVRPVLAHLLRHGGEPDATIEALGLAQLRDEDRLREVVSAVLSRHPAQVARYRAGKTGLLAFFMGQVMDGTGGRADPVLARTLLTEALEAPAG